LGKKTITIKSSLKMQIERLPLQEEQPTTLEMTPDWKAVLEGSHQYIGGDSEYSLESSWSWHAMFFISENMLEVIRQKVERNAFFNANPGGSLEVEFDYVNEFLHACMEGIKVACEFNRFDLANTFLRTLNRSIKERKQRLLFEQVFEKPEGIERKGQYLALEQLEINIHFRLAGVFRRLREQGIDIVFNTPADLVNRSENSVREITSETFEEGDMIVEKPGPTKKIALMLSTGMLDNLLLRFSPNGAIDASTNFTKAASIINIMTDIDTSTIRKCLEAHYKQTDNNKKNDPFNNPANRDFVDRTKLKFNLK
jgi:hypothetical protein